MYIYTKITQVLSNPSQLYVTRSVTWVTFYRNGLFYKPINLGILHCYTLLRTLFSFEKYETKNDDVGVQRKNLEPKKWSVFDIVGICSSGVKMTRKV